MSLGDLALIVAAGLAGPLLAAGRRAFVPVVVGEIVAGVILGRSGLDVVHADNAMVSFLAEAGFAILMLTVGQTCSPAKPNPYPRRHARSQAHRRHRSHPEYRASRAGLTPPLASVAISSGLRTVCG